VECVYVGTDGSLTSAGCTVASANAATGAVECSCKGIPTSVQVYPRAVDAATPTCGSTDSSFRSLFALVFAVLALTAVVLGWQQRQDASVSFVRLKLFDQRAEHVLIICFCAMRVAHLLTAGQLVQVSLQRELQLSLFPLALYALLLTSSRLWFGRYLHLCALLRLPAGGSRFNHDSDVRPSTATSRMPSFWLPGSTRVARPKTASAYSLMTWRGRSAVVGGWC
jgi:hypothetical protein